MRRVARRTLQRRLRKQELWNGNYEPPLCTFITDPAHIIRWSWHTYRQRADEALAVATKVDAPIVVRLSSQPEVDAWIRGPLTALSSVINDA